MQNLTSLWIIAATLATSPDPLPPINPVPRQVVSETLLAEWTFDRDSEGWGKEHDCSLSAAGGLLKVQCTGNDPYFHRRVDVPGGEMVLKMKARVRTAGEGVAYWTTRGSRWGEDKTSRFRLKHDWWWRDYQTRFTVSGQLVDLRIDPGSGPGEFEIDRISLVREVLHPLTIERIETSGKQVRFQVKNHGAEPMRFASHSQDYAIDGGATLWIDRPVDGTKPLEAVSLDLEAPDLPPVRRTIFLHHPEAQTSWIERPLGDLLLRVASDGSVARVVRQDGQIVAILGPLVLCDGKLPVLTEGELHVPESARRRRIVLQGEDIRVHLHLDPNVIGVSIHSAKPCTGPVVRAFGSLEQGLFAGLEYLGKGERSSSKLDVETDEHLRFAPDPIKVTMPLMAFVTDKISVSMSWADMPLQPLYATPNFFDGTDDHYMALHGNEIQARIRVDRAPLEEAILAAVKPRGLPPLPEPPRTPAEQWKLCLQALDGPLKTDAGWGHCAEPNWTRQPYADMASTVWRLTGQAPDLPRLVPGGAHVDNDAIYFVTGRAGEWLDYKSRQVKGILDRQQPDGSFRYTGKYRRGHFEDTASGICARPAADLLEYARITGDRTALQAGLRTLDYMKRFRTPRGAQTWEVPLHTPDLLASAHLVAAYVRGYELTGNEEYLKQARKWALTGVPFVYLWSRYPIMAYATPPVYGATNWVAPCWIGLPVQWVGGVYAYALTMLAPYDDSLDWNHLARGILIAAEQMQYPDGEYAGLLPDVFALEDQQRLPARINPCALVSLRLVLDGQLDSLSVAGDGARRVAAPFPVTLRDGQATMRARQGTRYQVLVDGKRIVDIESAGEDLVALP